MPEIDASGALSVTKLKAALRKSHVPKAPMPFVNALKEVHKKMSAEPPVDVAKEKRLSRTVCECQPCKSGYFSAKENGACRLWTNCSAMGQKVLEQGSATEDVKCTIPTPVTAGLLTTSWTPISSSHRWKVTSLKNFTTTNHIAITPHLPTPSSIDWGTLSLIVIGVVLLLASAGVILTTITQINRKKTNRRFIRGERCKVPVQEESTSSDSSLTKDCPA
ncbi:tumor necrosis factor receptor superfamily member 4 isoform X5 [Bufo bufo]|nr:tumor necrosis factor receptor superfamily member 4 isoform X5 [Bufo bufo]